MMNKSRHPLGCRQCVMYHGVGQVKVLYLKKCFRPFTPKYERQLRRRGSHRDAKAQRAMSDLYIKRLQRRLK